MSFLCRSWQRWATRLSNTTTFRYNSRLIPLLLDIFVCHPAMLHPNSRHSEGLGTRICRPQPGPSSQLPEMLSVPEEVVYRGDVPFLLNVNHKGVQFVTSFSKFTMIMYYDFWRIFGGFQYIHVHPHIGCLIHMVTIHKHFSFGFICTSFLRELFIHSNLLWRRLHFSRM